MAFQQYGCVQPSRWLRQLSAGRSSRLWLASACAALGLIGATGCASFDALGVVTKVATPEPACQVAATWSPDVMFVPDPAHMGQPGPGIAGRVYLFGPKIGYPTTAEGTLLVELFNDAGAPPPGVARAPIEKWTFDKDTLKRLLRKDAIGEGYTIFLPWGSYRPTITRVHLRVCFQPVQGTPLYSEGSPMTLHHPQQPVG
ncbi:MAG TPA: hypothetical protein VFA18_06895 [Gemmataceae bacterium]|nr:hypothetical protein [Gemmataceae bacterium]